jgi:hypothetical protein
MFETDHVRFESGSKTENTRRLKNGRIEGFPTANDENMSRRRIGRKCVKVPLWKCGGIAGIEMVEELGVSGGGGKWATEWEKEREKHLRETF